MELVIKLAGVRLLKPKFVNPDGHYGETAPEKMDESSIEHIEGLIKEGYNQGELCLTSKTGEEFRGWWHIETESDR